MPEFRYEDSVFLNVPFDRRYESLLRALVFTIHDCGLVARCAREIEDGGQVRIEWICSLMSESMYGIHDISRTGLDKHHRLPRFNMPLELGLFMGAQRFGSPAHRRKRCLILDREEHRYRNFCSDISGQEVRAHRNCIEGAVTSVRDWLSSHLISRQILIPGGGRILERYRDFCRQLPAVCRGFHLESRNLLYSEYVNLLTSWLKSNPW